MRKYILGLFISFTMALIMLPSTALAQENYEIYVGGIGLNNGDYLTIATESVPAEKTTTEPDDGKYAYYKDGVLTLNNYIYKGEGASFGYNSYSLIFSESDLDIVLKGENTLTHTITDEYVTDNGIKVEGKLQIGGTGKLNINSSYAISSYDSIVISNAILTLNADEVGISSNNIEILDGTIDISSPFHGISSSDGEIYISGGTLDIEAYYPIYNTSGNITISGGTLNLTTNETRGDGISTYSSGTIEISGGVINIKAYEHGIIAGNIYGYNSNDDTKLIISNGIINIDAQYGIRASFSDVNISGGNLNIETTDYGIYSKGNLNISDANILVDVADDKTAIQCHAEIILSDNLNITSNNDTLKNTNYLKLVRTYKLMFEANGGSFENGTTYAIDNWESSLYDSLIYPTRDGYKFKGYYTEKTGGTKFEFILNESGIDSNMTFYAQWEKNSAFAPLTPGEENPNTFDDIGNSIIIGIMSLIGLVVFIIYLKEGNKVRA